LAEFLAFPATVHSLKASLLPAQVAGFCIQAESTGAMLQAHAGSGIVRGHWVNDLTRERANTILNQWMLAATAGRGNVVVTLCPADWIRILPVWGYGRADSWLMRRVKVQMDPTDLFNPGRFVEAI
jgi:glycolate oxidase FAD binding subunit